MPIYPEKYALLLKSIEDNDPTLKILDFSSQQFDDAGVDQLDDALSHNTNIKSLNFQNCYFNRVTASRLFYTFLRSENLRHIYLPISDASQAKVMRLQQELEESLEIHNKIIEDNKQLLFIFMLQNTRGFKVAEPDFSGEPVVKRLKHDPVIYRLPVENLCRIRDFLLSKPKTMQISW